MRVTELNPDQLDELRMFYNYDKNDSTAIVDETDIDNKTLFDYYAGIEFVAEDFTAPGEDCWHNPSVDASEQLAPLPELITI